MIQELENRIKALNEEIFNKVSEVYKTVDALVKQNIGEDFYVESENITTNIMSLCSKTFPSIALNICHGYEYNYKTDSQEFCYDTNVSAMGTFSLMNADSRQFAYYTMLSVVMGNTNFRESVKNILFNLAEETKPLVKERNDASSKRFKLQAEAKRAKEKEAEEKEYEIQLEHVLKSSESEYALIKKGTGGRFIYRAQPVKIMGISPLYNKLKYEEERFNNSYLPKGVKYAVVQISKIKPV